MYKELYEIISNFIFNGNPTEFTYGELICQAIPAILCTVLVMLPFIIVWRIIRTLL